MPSALPRVRVWVKGREYVLRRTATMTDADVDRWRRHTIADAERDLIPPKPTGWFADDVTAYLPARKAMPTYKERKRDMALWAEWFGRIGSLSITPLMIQSARDAWLTDGPAMVQRWEADPVTRKNVRTWVAEKRPLAASTVNHRLRALRNFYRVLYPEMRNPVAAVEEAEETDGPPQSIPTELIVRILAAVSDQAHAAKGQTRGEHSRARARLHCMAWVGLPPKQLGAVKPEHVGWTDSTLWLPARRKGKGSHGQRIPITPEGLAAFEMLKAADAFGPFRTETVRRAWQRACRVVQRDMEAKGAQLERDLTAIIPYALRHSHATATLAATKDIRTARAFLSHGDERTTMRYAAAAVPDWLADAAQKLATYRGESRPKPDTGSDTRKKGRKK